VIAEIELVSESAVVQLPDWAGEEITGDPRFSKSNMLDAHMRALRAASSRSSFESVLDVPSAARFDTRQIGLQLPALK
jgi:hypothetical protein